MPNLFGVALPSPLLSLFFLLLLLLSLVGAGPLPRSAVCPARTGEGTKTITGYVATIVGCFPSDSSTPAAVVSSTSTTAVVTAGEVDSPLPAPTTPPQQGEIPAWKTWLIAATQGMLGNMLFIALLLVVGLVFGYKRGIMTDWPLNVAKWSRNLFRGRQDEAPAPREPATPPSRQRSPRPESSGKEESPQTPERGPYMARSTGVQTGFESAVRTVSGQSRLAKSSAVQPLEPARRPPESAGQPPKPVGQLPATVGQPSKTVDRAVPAAGSN